METVKYQLIRNSYESIDEDLTSLITLLNTVPSIKTHRNNEDHNKILLKYSYEHGSFDSVIEVTKIQGTEGGSDTRVVQPAIILNCQPLDNFTPNIVQGASGQLGFRFFSQNLNSFIPYPPSIIESSSIVLDDKIRELLKAKTFKPIFVIINSTTFYAENLQDNSIHFLNNYLVDYFFKFGFKENEETPEFSYKVAPDLKRFVPMFDKGLIPMDFYSYYQKSLKIVNHSGLDINKPNRKIFFQPHLFELNGEKQRFDSVAPRGSAALIADKIRQGENLDAAIKRYLKEQFSITSDFIGAFVQRVIDFDRDKERILTSRLFVDVFVEKITNKSEFEEKSQRGWVSLNEKKDY